ncbi:MAG: 6-bladed beta-propeller [Bryobacteraceae bacterium]
MQLSRHPFLFLPSIAFLIASHSLAADKAPPKKIASAAPKPTELIWPLPPDPPRVRWVTEYSDLAKIGKTAKKASWIEKVSGAKTPDEKQELRRPYGVATDSHGRIFVADSERKVVFVIDRDGKALERREGTGRAPLVMPVGVAIDAQDRLFVSDAATHSITYFDAAGEPVAQFGSAQLGRPGGIAIDRNRSRLYVADAKESRIAVFDINTLKFVRFIGSASKPGKREPGTFANPSNIAVDRRGDLYIADTFNQRIQILDAEGKFIKSIGTQGDAPGEFIRPKGIAVDSEGHIYVADAEFNNFQILTREGQPLLAVGALGTNPGQFALVAGLFIDSNDQIYTTEQYHGRVQVFQYIPQPVPTNSKADPKADGKEANSSNRH